MVLNSVYFILFLAVAAAGYFVLPQKYQNAFLLLASYVFYFWTLPVFGLLMSLTTLFSFWIAKCIAAAEKPARRKAWLIGSILVNLAVLAVFKYGLIPDGWIAQLSEHIAALGAGEGFLPSYAAPLGISFYTLQVIGYNVDVYRGAVQPEKRLVNYALFVSFFAHITSGPIARAGELLPQFKRRHSFNYDNLLAGCQRFLTGAFKKVVVADGIAVLVNGVYGSPTADNPLGNLEPYSGWMLIIVTLLYAFQLYCDFSGYTDMALGVARVLGFSLRENFRAPYRATSMNGLWQRWHMSLTAWLRDYVYFPLGGSRKGFGRKLFNILVVYLVSGLWHGNTASFLLWGLFHGLFRMGEELWSVRRPKKEKADGFVLRNLKRAAVYVLWAFSFITFKAVRFPQLRYVITHLFAPSSLTDTVAQILKITENGLSDTGLYYLIFFGGIAIGALITVLFDARMDRDPALANPLANYKTKQRWLLYWVMGLLTAAFYLIALSSASGAPSFIYENF